MQRLQGLDLRRFHDDSANLGEWHNQNRVLYDLTAYVNNHGVLDFTALRQTVRIIMTMDRDVTTAVHMRVIIYHWGWHKNVELNSIHADMAQALAWLEQVIRSQMPIKATP